MKLSWILSLSAVIGCSGQPVESSTSPTFIKFHENWQITSDSGAVFPLYVSPPKERAISPDVLRTTLKNSKEYVLQAALDHGAVLFRGFPIENAISFAQFAHSLGLEEGTLEGSAAPRNVVSGTNGTVFTSNESPPERKIPFHHEMAQTAQPPAYILFYCEHPPAFGGATPIVLSQEVAAYAQQTHPKFTAKLRERGVRYHRTLPAATDPSSALGKSWKETFNVTSRAQAEDFLRHPSSGFSSWKFVAPRSSASTRRGACSRGYRAGGNERAGKGVDDDDDEGGGGGEEGCEGTGEEDLRVTTAVHAALAFDPRTGREVFFNQLVAAFTGWSDSRNDPETSVTFGGESSSSSSASAGQEEGELLDRDAMLDIARFMQTRRVAVPWERGDVLLLDNRQTMHARDPFALHPHQNLPNRRILASVWGRAKPPPPPPPPSSPPLRHTSSALEAAEEGAAATGRGASTAGGAEKSQGGTGKRGDRDPTSAAAAAAAFASSPSAPLAPFLVRRFGGGGSVTAGLPNTRDTNQDANQTFGSGIGAGIDSGSLARAQVRVVVNDQSKRHNQTCPL